LRRAHRVLKSFSFVVSPDDAGRRLDQVLAARVPELSRRLARVLLDVGGVFVDDVRAKQAGRPVSEGQKIVAHVGGALARATKQLGENTRAYGPSIASRPKLNSDRADA